MATEYSGQKAGRQAVTGLLCDEEMGGGRHFTSASCPSVSHWYPPAACVVGFRMTVLLSSSKGDGVHPKFRHQLLSSGIEYWTEKPKDTEWLEVVFLMGWEPIPLDGNTIFYSGINFDYLNFLTSNCVTPFQGLVFGFSL